MNFRGMLGQRQGNRPGLFGFVFKQAIDPILKYQHQRHHYHRDADQYCGFVLTSGLHGYDNVLHFLALEVAFVQSLVRKLIDTRRVAT